LNTVKKSRERLQENYKKLGHKAQKLQDQINVLQLQQAAGNEESTTADITENKKSEDGQSNPE